LVLAGVYHADVPPGNIPLSAVESLSGNPLVGEVIPLALGARCRVFRSVGTEPAFVAHYGAALASGHLWEAPLDAVLGSEVARASDLKAGSTFAGSHGLAEGGGMHEDTRYTVVGVLAPTGSVIDRLVLTGIDSVWKVHEHQREDDEEKSRPAPASPKSATASSTGSAREVTLPLVKYKSPLAAASLPRSINAQTVLQSAAPAFESARLMTVFGVGTDVIRAFALLMIAAAALGLFVALTQALDERRYDIAIMRAVGASPSTVVGVLMVESLLLCAFGLVVGLALAHGLAANIGAWLPAAAPLETGARSFRAEEWAVAALALGVGIMATFIPGWRAYRLDVAPTLAEG